jgi:hypothetical protein
LDGNCTSNSNCTGSAGLICQGGICLCNTPWYYPCTTGCGTLIFIKLIFRKYSFQIEIQRGFAYEGERCLRNENCLDNAQCNNASGVCMCNVGYTAINGACCKLLDRTKPNKNFCFSF